jgi:hypothetical protein
MFAIEDLGKQSFLGGVRSIPHATDVFHYSGLKFLGLDFTYTFIDGRNMASGWSQTLTSVELIYLVAAFLIGARTWRLPASWRWWAHAARGHHQRLVRRRELPCCRRAS